LSRAVAQWAILAARCAASISGITVDSAGRVYFTDWIKNKLWSIDPSGAVSVIGDRHTHHLRQDNHGVLYGENATLDGSVVSLWKMPTPGSFEDVIPPAARDQRPVYQGGPFLLEADGSIVTVRNCELWRISNGHAVKLAGDDCGERAWTNDVLRFAHLHGTLAAGPEGSFYFTDARTVRRIASDGSVSTLQGAAAKLFGDPLPGEFRFNRALGLDVDSAGKIYVADSREGVKILDSGLIAWLQTSERGWSPSGIAVHDGAIFVVENRPDYLKPLAPIIGNPRVRRIAADGSSTVLFTVRNSPLAIGSAILLLGAILAVITVTWRCMRKLNREGSLHIQGCGNISI